MRRMLCVFATFICFTGCQAMHKARLKIDIQLLNAADNGDDAELVKRILLKGADINVRNKHEETALIISARKNYFKVMQHLLRAAKINVNAQNCYNETALMHATAHENYQAVQLLLDSGAQTNLENKDEETAYQLAKKYEYPKIAALLTCKKDRGYTLCEN